MSKIETAADMLAKSTPPATVSVMSICGVPLNEVVYIATLAWILWQLGCSIYDRWRK